MSDIVEFLEQRLAEDEAVIRAVLDFYPDSPKAYTHTDLDPDADGFNAFDPAPAAYLRRFTPQRALAEIAAKREVLREVQCMINEIEWEWGTGNVEWEWGTGNAGEDALHAMALVYQDHEDYQQEWRPQDFRVYIGDSDDEEPDYVHVDLVMSWAAAHAYMIGKYERWLTDDCGDCVAYVKSRLPALRALAPGDDWDDSVEGDAYRITGITA